LEHFGEHFPSQIRFANSQIRPRVIDRTFRARVTDKNRASLETSFDVHFDVADRKNTLLSVETHKAKGRVACKARKDSRARIKIDRGKRESLQPRVFDFSALVMSLYPNAWQEPLSTSLFWRWLGLTLALSLHGAVCTRYRVLGLAATLVLAVVPYLWLESRLARRGKTLAPL